MQNYMPQYRGINQTIGYKVIPVSSLNEVNAITVDFNGTPTYFHNQANNEIYVKRFDIQTGLTTTQKFIKTDKPESDLSEAKPETGINSYDEKLDAINERIDGLKELLEKKVKGVKSE